MARCIDTSFTRSVTFNRATYGYEKTKYFERTIFSAATLSAALDELGADRQLYLSEITHGNDSIGYDSEGTFLQAYERTPDSAHLIIRAPKANMTLHVSRAGTNLEVEASDVRTIDLLVWTFEKVAAESRLPEMTEPIQLERFCVPTPLRWETLPSLASLLHDSGISIENQSIRLVRYPDTIEFTKWEDALANVRDRGEPKQYSISWRGFGKTGTFCLRISRGRYEYDEEYFICLTLTGLTDLSIADNVVAFLGLTVDKPQSPVTQPERSAFIAHRFNKEGEQAADRLARFLQLLGFDVKTGRGFSPESVSEKVKKRIATQAVVFVILTAGEDDSWLTQESILGYAKDKPLFVLRDSRVEFKAAMLGDLEYIPFDTPAIEGAVIPILEGLKELGYLHFH